MRKSILTVAALALSASVGKAQCPGGVCVLPASYTAPRALPVASVRVQPTVAPYTAPVRVGLFSRVRDAAPRLRARASCR